MGSIWRGNKSARLGRWRPPDSWVQQGSRDRVSSGQMMNSIGFEANRGQDQGVKPRKTFVLLQLEIKFFTVREKKDANIK